MQEHLSQFTSTRQIIRSFEAKALNKRTFAQKVADYFASSFGTNSFLIFNLIVFALWIVINLGLIPAIKPFDPFPFVLLTTSVSLEAIFLSIIVLMSQNRQGFINSLREELDLQVNLIAEAEITKILKLVNELHEHNKVKSEKDPELEEMLQQIDTSYIERVLTEQLVKTQKSPLGKSIREVTKVAKIPVEIAVDVGEKVTKDIETKVINPLTKNF